jgi:hypothetical protein
MRAEEYREQKLEVEGWPVHLVSYKLGDVYWAQADNVSPGACLARISAPTREQAEAQALEKARKLLSRTRKLPV